MLMSCGGCGAHGSYELFTADPEARACFAAAQKLPGGFGPLLLDYLTLFRPTKRLLTWKRARKLMNELVPMIAAGSVPKNGKQHAAPIEAWRFGIEQMMSNRETLQLPLKNHRYLISIIAGEAPRLASAAEAAVEQSRRVESSRREGTNSRALAELSSEIARRKRFREPEMTKAETEDFLARLGND